VIVDPLHEPNACATTSPHLATEAADTDDEKRVPTTMRERWARIWPSLLAGGFIPKNRLSARTIFNLLGAGGC
jgi:hypothetical protein